jgi:hypothetical protein
LEEFPATEPIAAAVADGVAVKVRDRLREVRWDLKRFDTDEQARRVALTHGRLLALAEVMVMKPIRPLLERLATGNAVEREDYRILHWCYVDGLPLAAIARVLGIGGTPEESLAVASNRVRGACIRWRQMVHQAFGAGPGGIAFPKPGQL